MRESEYLWASNRTRVRAIKECLLDIVPGAELGVDEKLLADIKKKVNELHRSILDAGNDFD